MGTLSTLFGFGSSSSSSEELPDIFPMPVALKDFVNTDTECVYTKILVDVIERTSGIKDEHIQLLWDNCLKSESPEGLITLLSKAMAQKNDLFIVYDRSTSVIRKATNDEEKKIKEDYEKHVKSSVGIFISFKNYGVTDMVKLYSALEYCNVSSLYKSSNLAKSIQIRISKLRESVSLADSQAAKDQAKTVAKSLGAGKDVLLDSNDEIVTASPDMSATKESTSFVDRKRSFYLGLPESYITGVPQGGLGDSGNGDEKKVDRGLKSYYFSIIKPVVETIFEIKTKFKSRDSSHISAALETIKTFELVGEEYVSKENKTAIINSLLDLDNSQTGDPKSNLAKDTALKDNSVKDPKGFVRDPNA